jgi:serine/threonine-protein kinase
VTADGADAAGADELRRRVEDAVREVFDIEGEIGRGGMAVVYRALDRRLRRRVALKVLPPDLAFRADVRSRFVREAQLAAQLAHPNIVPIYAVDETGGVVWFAMGLVEGEPLAKMLAHHPRPDVPFVRRVLREVAAGLAYAHEHGVVHRDIKPDNILVDGATGRALVTDFGIARAAEGDLRLTATGVAVGTPAYMSPEQAMGEKDVDGRADVYALGVVGWQMLAGELPFQSENTPGMLMKHISEPPRSLSTLRTDLPDNLVYAIERAMAKGRNDRWPDAMTFHDALDADAEVPDAPFSNAHTPAGRVPAIRSDARGSAASGPRGPSPNKPWRFDPLRDSALESDSGADAIKKWREERHAWRERHGRERLSDRVRNIIRDDARDGADTALSHEPLSRREERHLRREERRREREEQKAAMTPEDRIRSVQRGISRYVLMVGFLAAINFFTSPFFPWFLFPALGMGIGLLTRISNLWVDGISLGQLFRRQPRTEAAPAVAGERSRGRLRGGRAAVPKLPPPDLSGVPRDVLDGPHGSTVREAAEARQVIEDVVSRLTPDEILNLPDVSGTVKSLEERVRALAAAMHQLDKDANPAALQRLEQRLNDARAAATPGSEAERRVTLLERQHATLQDLATRRDTVAQQLDSASILLQTMKLDLLKLRSAGIETRIADSTLATQEARAVAVDIERVVDAANEVRKL